MIRYFKNYELKITDQKFEIETGIFTEKTAKLILIDNDDKKSETYKLGYVSEDEIFRRIENKADFNIKNCFVENFSLSKFREKNNLPSNKLVTIRNFNAQNSFFASKQEINFHRANFIGKQAIFSGSTFFAPKVNFSGSNFEKSDADLDYITFNCPELTFKKATFGDYDVEFKNAIFYKGTKNFEETFFGKGDLNFLNAEFNDGDVNFSGSKFGEGRTTFRVSRFGKGKIDFSRVDFGNGDTSFEKVHFDDGELTFRSAKFGNGKKDFTRCEMGKGKKLFVNTIFGNGNITFKNTNFGDGKVSFKLANFGEGQKDFHFSHFGECDLLFERTVFRNGIVNFRGAEFGSGRVLFNKTEIGNGDVIFEGSDMKTGKFEFKNGVLGNGAFNFENALFANADLLIQDVNFGEGKVTFKKSEFQTISLEASQLNNYFDLRIKSCQKLDLSNVIVKDILDIRSFEHEIKIEELDFSGLRLLGRLYLDWESSDVKNLILKQDTTFRNKAEQFRTLKENYRNIGLYQSEDYAYVEFKRAEAKADLREAKNKSFFQKIWAYFSYAVGWLIFDKMGLYATNPVRVLVSMGIVYLGFVLLFFFDSLTGTGEILYGIGDEHALSGIFRTFYFSAVTFLTIGYGDYYPTGANRVFIAVEGFAGLFMMSYFTVAFVRKILR